MKSKILALLVILGSSFSAQAERGERADRSNIAAAIKACESSSYNTSGVTFSAPTPGQRPNFTEAQRNLLQACEAAGIIPQHPHGGRGGGAGDQQAPPPDAAR